MLHFELVDMDETLLKKKYFIQVYLYCESDNREICGNLEITRTDEGRSHSNETGMID